MCLGKRTEGVKCSWTQVTVCTVESQNQASVKVGSDCLQGRRNCLPSINSGKVGNYLPPNSDSPAAGSGIASR